MQTALPMTGHGFYNAHSELQAASATFGLEQLLEAAEAVPLDASMGIADYGSSQGRNSMPIIAAAIDRLRNRANQDIWVHHVDLPSNDFTTLFEILDNEPVSYLQNRKNVYVGAVGRSFYRQVLPSNSISLGWTCIANHWLSRVPCDIPGAIISTRAPAELRRQWSQQAADDWRVYLQVRARELRPGGRMVMVNQCAGGEDGHAGAESLLAMLEATLRDLLQHQTITQQEFDRFNLPVYHRTISEYRAPFDGGEVEGLKLLSIDVTEGPDPLYARFEIDRDAHAFARDYTAWNRAIEDPRLRAALDPDRTDIEEVAATFYQGLATRIEADAENAHCHLYLATLVIERER